MDTLLAREEKRCDAARWPGVEALRGGLSVLAFAMQRAGERGTSVEENWAAEQLAGRVADPRALLYLSASATLLDLSGGRVRFIHQLVQEYFAALALGEAIQMGDDLSPYWPEGWIEPSGWEETTVLLAGAMPDMKPLLERLLVVHPGLAARCIAESGGSPLTDRIEDTVRQRLTAIIMGHRTSVRELTAAYDALNHVGDLREGVGLKDGLPDIRWSDLIPAGPFTMGNSQTTDPEAYNDEQPPHTEIIDEPYRVSIYPITNAQYDAFVQDGGYTEQWKHCWTPAGWEWKGSMLGRSKAGGVLDLPTRPVVEVSWYETVAYCAWLSEKTGLRIELPTEAQWERAARGVDGRLYPWGTPDITPNHAN